MELRPLRLSDIDEVLAFANRLADERRADSSLGLVGFDKRYTRAKELKWLQGVLKGIRKRTVVDVAALCEGNVVGHCSIYRRSFPDVAHTGVLGIAITKDYRGLGIGEALIRAALARAKGEGIHVIELEVFATNPEAKKLYEKVGFKPAGSIPKKFLREGNYIDSEMMYIHLREPI